MRNYLAGVRVQNPFSHAQGAVSYTHLDVYKRQTIDNLKVKVRYKWE